MRQAFINWKPRGDHAASLVDQIVQIGADYDRQRLRLTLRQLYYQLVARGLIANDMRSYKNIGALVDKARLGGYLDWNYIEDRTRNVYGTDGHQTSPEDAIRSWAAAYRRQLWEPQPNHVEVWVEKEALVGVIQRAARDVGINYFACKGYVSQSEMYAGAQRFLSHLRWGGKKRIIVIHLGDHDPSGIDMTRDIGDRLTTFMEDRAYWLTVERIALNMDQVEEMQPPPNPAKMTDSRFADYAALYGDESWELDAIEPTALHQLIVDTALQYRDETLWDEAKERQETERRQLQDVAAEWDLLVRAIEHRDIVEEALEAEGV
jgi:hypothetical protein